MTEKTITPEAREYYEAQVALTTALNEVNCGRSLRNVSMPWTAEDAIAQEDAIFLFIKETEERLATLNAEWIKIYKNNRNGKLDAYVAGH